MSNPPGTPRPRYEKLQAWVACHELNLAIIEATMTWSPPQRADVMAEEARKAGIHAATNIMLGSGLGDRRQFRRHLSIAVGKLARLGAILEMAKEVGLLPPETWGELEALRDHAARLTGGLYASLDRRKRVTGPRPPLPRSHGLPRAP
jgi:four helix bundle protein